LETTVVSHFPHSDYSHVTEVSAAWPRRSETCYFAVVIDRNLPCRL